MYSQELSRDNFGLIADWAKHQEGRNWRPLADTAIAAPFLYGARHDWSSRRRGVDFYNEGALIWLDADTLIRQKSNGKKSLDDFCHAFYGGGDGAPEVKPYNLDDIVNALNAVVPFDWKGFLDRRIYQAPTEAPLDGITRGGWRLAYRAEPSELSKAREGDDKSLDLRSSLGLIVEEGGEIVDVIPNSPADQAGVGAGMKLLGADGWRFSLERLKDRLATTNTGDSKITLLLEDGAQYHTAVSGICRRPAISVSGANRRRKRRFGRHFPSKTLGKMRPYGSVENPAWERGTGTFFLRRLRKNEPVPGGVFYRAVLFSHSPTVSVGEFAIPNVKMSNQPGGIAFCLTEIKMDT